MFAATITIDRIVALTALVVSILSFAFSFYFWRRSFRPIVTDTVKTDAGGNVSITYNLVLLNSGTIPAKNVRLSADQESLARAFGQDANDKTKLVATRATTYMAQPSNEVVWRIIVCTRRGDSQRLRAQVFWRDLQILQYRKHGPIVLD